MMGAVEQQVLPSQGDLPGGFSLIQTDRLGPPMHQVYGAPSPFPSVALGSSVIRSAGGVILWGSSLACPPTIALIEASASRVPETYGELGLAIEHPRRESDLLQESRALIDAIRG